jgi:hypothetical protein
MVRQQFFMLLLDEARAIETLPALLPPDPELRAEAFAVLSAVIGATGDLPPEAARRLAEVERIFVCEPVADVPNLAARRIRPARRSA